MQAIRIKLNDMKSTKRKKQLKKLGIDRYALCKCFELLLHVDRHACVCMRARIRVCMHVCTKVLLQHMFSSACAAHSSHIVLCNISRYTMSPKTDFSGKEFAKDDGE